MYFVIILPWGTDDVSFRRLKYSMSAETDERYERRGNNDVFVVAEKRSTGKSPMHAFPSASTVSPATSPISIYRVGFNDVTIVADLVRIYVGRRMRARVYREDSH